MNLRRAIFTVLFCLIAFSISAQDSYVKNRWSLKMAYTKYYLVLPESHPSGIYDSDGNYQLDLNYGISNLFEVGIYSGYSNVFGTNFLVYGVNTNFHILPLFITAKDFRFDTYIMGKIGGENTLGYGDKSILSYGVGLGAAFYPLKKLGVFGEYSFGKYYFNDNKKFRFGITYKFNKK